MRAHDPKRTERWKEGPIQETQTEWEWRESGSKWTKFFFAYFVGYGMRIHFKISMNTNPVPNMYSVGPMMGIHKAYSLYSGSKLFGVQG